MIAPYIDYFYLVLSVERITDQHVRLSIVCYRHFREDPLIKHLHALVISEVYVTMILVPVHRHFYLGAVVNFTFKNSLTIEVKKD